MDPPYIHQPSISLKEYPRIVKRRKWSLILPAVFISIAGILIAMLLPPVYKSTSTILIEEQEIPQDFVMTTVTSYAEQRLQTINQRIMSTTRLLEIINQFDLYKKLREKRTTEEIVEKMRDDVELKNISAEVVDHRTGKPTTATIAFSLSYEGKETPQTVQRVATVLASLFLEENLKVREKQTKETFDFLDNETHRVDQSLNEIESKLSKFKEEHINELPELLQVNTQSLQNMESNIERLMEQLRTLKGQEGYLETQLATLDPYLENKDKERLDILKVQLVNLLTKFTNEHPDVVQTRDEIAALEKKLSANKGDSNQTKEERPDNPAYVTLLSQLSSTRADIESIKRQEKDYRGRADEYRRRIEATPKAEETYNNLMMEKANTQAKYNDLIQKQMAAKVAQGLEKEQKGERFTLIDPARLPEKPSKPNRLAIILVGCVLGVAAGAGLAAVREFSDQTVRNPDLLTFATSLPVLASIPVLVTERDRKKTQMRRIIWTSAVFATLVIGILVFQFMVMDLDIFWIKVLRRLDMLFI